jgi:hypothetical protein
MSASKSGYPLEYDAIATAPQPRQTQVMQDVKLRPRRGQFVRESVMEPRQSNYPRRFGAPPHKMLGKKAQGPPVMAGVGSLSAARKSIVCGSTVQSSVIGYEHRREIC